MRDQELREQLAAHDLPTPANAAARVREYLEWWGDGLIDVAGPSGGNAASPLYARDLEVLVNAVRDLRADARVIAVEIGWLRREVEFEASGERWSNSIVGRPGHEYVNGYRACNCGAECLTLGDWERHLLASRVSEGKPLCACVTDEQAGQLAWAGFSRPVCAVHPEGGAL